MQIYCNHLKAILLIIFFLLFNIHLLAQDTMKNKQESIVKDNVIQGDVIINQSNDSTTNKNKIEKQDKGFYLNLSEYSNIAAIISGIIALLTFLGIKLNVLSIKTKLKHFFNSKEIKEAKQHHDQASAKQLQKAEQYNDQGLAFYKKANYQQAIIQFDKALKIRLEALGDKHPSTAASYNNLGLAYYTKGEHDKAIRNHEKAL